MQAAPARLLEEIREEARRAAEKLPWQPIADSPTVKSYTDWRFFEKLAARGADGWRLPPGRWDTVLGPCGSSGHRLVAEPLGQLVRPGDSRLAALHYAALSPAAVSYLENRGSRVEAALCAPTGGWGSRHVVLRLSGGETLLYIPSGSGGSTVVEVHVEPGADAGLAVVTSGAPVAHGLVVAKLVGEGSRLRYASIALGSGGQTRVEDLNLVASPGGGVNARALAVGAGPARIDYIMDSVQDAERTVFEGAVEGVALGESLVVARGSARVKQRARRSRSVFEASVLMLGERSRGYTAPMMEIETGDVEEAVHHASQQRAPRTALFYLASRGLSTEEATSLILEGKLSALAEGFSLVAERLLTEARRLMAQAAGPS